MSSHVDPGAAGRGLDLPRAVLAGGAIFLVWRAARAFKGLLRAAFGLGLAGYWTGFWS
ncbi:hypothetical protein L599_003200000140 [Luteimonas sp. J16]|jgi:hypothetical protein|uniref:hypothetical protein n=1 Tax=unclassified Luteimonas TaxID=2629088 RepID=UPI0004ADAF5A|nr:MULTISPECIES: hypothetical protein [unclassified Luteimonas]TWG90414.1 hypothetical protein L599_003200000140 [Luteimonas sp. J16]